MQIQKDDLQFKLNKTEFLRNQIYDLQIEAVKNNETIENLKFNFREEKRYSKKYMDQSTELQTEVDNLQKAKYTLERSYEHIMDLNTNISVREMNCTKNLNQLKDEML